jgi:hypothetical protein
LCQPRACPFSNIPHATIGRIDDVTALTTDSEISEGLPVRIFISYRRMDQAGFAGRLFDWINRDPELEDSAFMDVDGIAAGQNYEQVLRDRLANCDIVIAIIGDRWLSAADESGQVRLMQEHDIVRHELVAAFSMGKRVMPVLVDNTRHPTASQLPEPLHPLVTCQSLMLTHRTFDADAPRIISEAKEALRQAEASRAATKKRLWDRASFLQALTDSRGAATAEKMAQIIDWGRSISIGFKWGSGQKYGSFMLAAPDTGLSLFYGSTTGECYVYLENLQKSGRLADLAARERALRTLNEVHGILIPLHRAKDQYPGFQIGQVELADVPRLLRALEQVLSSSKGS